MGLRMGFRLCYCAIRHRSESRERRIIEGKHGKARDEPVFQGTLRLDVGGLLHLFRGAGNYGENGIGIERKIFFK